MRILLVRHGQTDWHDPKRAQGWSDVPLNDVGRAQAAALGKAMEGVTLDRIVASDLGRAQDTARALGRPFETDVRLRERNYGDWEGGGFEETNAKIFAKAQAEGVKLSQVQTPNGESVVDVWKRVEPIVEALWRSEGTTMVVAHGGVVAVMLSHFIHGRPESSHSFHFTNGSITELERRADDHMLLHRLGEPPSDDPIFRV